MSTTTGLSLAATISLYRETYHEWEAAGFPDAPAETYGAVMEAYRTYLAAYTVEHGKRQKAEGRFW